MIDRVLEPIYKTQKQLDEDAHHNLEEYVEQTHRHVQEIAKTYGFSLQYGKRTGGYETIESHFPKPEQDDILVGT